MTKKSLLGFTLVEILISIFIFGITISMIYGAFTSLIGNTDSIDDGINDYEMGKNCLNRISFDLQSIYVALPPEFVQPGFDADPGLYRVVGENMIVGINNFSKLRFTSYAHISFDQNEREGIAEIIYYVMQIDKEEYVLKRADNIYPYKPFEEKKSDPTICEKVKSLQFIYFDEEGEESETWDSDSDDSNYATPKSIKIKLEIGNEDSFQLFETQVALPIYRKKIG
jgi:general secretion pathway protein J